jgi:hypothetical protein
MIGVGEEGEWAVKIEPGDVILFSRQCSSMDIISASICLGAKIGTLSEWDHVGIVTKGKQREGEEDTDGEGVLEIVEANIGGITRRPLTKRLLRTRANKIAIRKIHGPKGADFAQRLDRTVDWYVDKGYNASLTDMTRAWYNSYSYMYYGLIFSLR